MCFAKKKQTMNAMKIAISALISRVRSSTR